MSEIIFFKSHFENNGGYKSYTDYRRLVDRAGYRTILIDEIDPASDNVYIGTPFDNENHTIDRAIWASGWPSARARIILHDLEYHLGSNALPPIPGLAEIWASDRWYARQIGARYIPLGSDVCLPLTPIQRNGQFDYDVATLSYNVWRRQRAHEDMQTRGLRVAPNAWGAERDRILERSRMMCHVHQHDHVPTVAPLRFAIAAGYVLPLITETLADGGIFSDAYRFMSDHAHIGELATKWLRPENRNGLNDLAHNLHQLLCVRNTFRSFIEAGL